MKNKCFSRNIFGPLRTQKIAQEVLRILISHAQERKILILRDLAKEVVPDLPQFNFAMKYVLQWIQTTLCELECSDDWNYGEIPCITTIILASPEQPTNAMDKRSRIEAGLNTPLPWEDYERYHILPAFEYPYWEQVMGFIFE